MSFAACAMSLLLLVLGGFVYREIGVLSEAIDRINTRTAGASLDEHELADAIDDTEEYEEPLAPEPSLPAQAAVRDGEPALDRPAEERGADGAR